jgi:uracil-DNA glycosylase
MSTGDLENNTVPSVKTWQSLLANEKQQPYFQAALDYVKNERKAGKTIYPKQTDIFNAFKLSPFEKVKVVLLGQDPYHGPGQAHGLAFSVQTGVAPPPSLKNIFKELQSDLGFTIPKHGCLEPWAEQGVLLLNTFLTVEVGKPQSHAKIGWEEFTDKVIKILSDEKEGLVFLLWGAHAQRKGELINSSKHSLLACAHPSPFSANRGFFGYKPFSKTNAILKANGQSEIDWQLPA